MRAVNWRVVVILVALVLLALVPPVMTAINQPFYLELFARVMIFAIAALSLDLILGYGGMVSFGHAAYLGLGGYAVAILSHYDINNGFLHLGVAIVASAAVAFVIGAISLRTSGVYFIMITLAFCQMLYFLGISIEEYGGDDGISTSRSDFGSLIDLGDSTTLYYFILAFLALFLYLLYRLVNSRFGMVIQGINSNERRMKALGFATFRYKLLAFVIAGVVCGVAGLLLANLTQFVTPTIMRWERSGEILVMVLMGGMGSLFGPVLGATVYLLLEEYLAALTEHWMIIFGPFLVILVLFARRGIYGLIPDRSRGNG
ncbi:MAG: branched-chain amino acid ABC transporter permease [Candidatus Eiseniibacteriota bacterium]